MPDAISPVERELRRALHFPPAGPLEAHQARMVADGLRQLERDATGPAERTRAYRAAPSPLPVSLDGWVAARSAPDRLSLVLPVAPRTKKNSTTLGIRQSEAYRRYRQQIVNGLVPYLARDWFPLPDAPYTLAAVFHVDRYGARADLLGLLQGLADALQDAGVVTDDGWFRAFDGSRVVPGVSDRPRVTLTISPLPADLDPSCSHLNTNSHTEG